MSYSIFARYYDRLTANVDYPARAAYFDALVRRHAPQCAGGILLDLACGTGSLAVELAGRGYDVIGVDASPEMLAEATAKAGGSVLLLCQRMEALDLYGTVDVAVCALDSLNHLPDEAALEAAIAKVALFLHPDGVFLFDVNTEYKHRCLLADNAYIYEPEGVVCIWRNHCRASGAVEIMLDFFEEQDDGSYLRDSEQFCERLYGQDTIEAILRRHGMHIEAVYGDDTFAAPGEQAQRLVYAAKKIPSI